MASAALDNSGASTKTTFHLFRRLHGFKIQLQAEVLNKSFSLQI